MPPPFILNGKTFDLSHLNPIKGKTIAQLRASRTNVAVHFDFSCHCWSRLPMKGESIPASYLVADGSVEKPRNRIFCEGRYELSRSLPHVIGRLLTSGGHVHKTARKNIVRVDLVAPVVAAAPAIKYFVFMKLEKRIPKGAQKYIRIFVESAYPENVLYDRVNYGKPFSFAKIIGECWEGRFPK